MTNEELLKIDICSRLPYGVKALSKFSLSPDIVSGMYINGAFFLGDNEKLIHSPIKPALFPVSYLTEEIQFRGEKIVPLIQLAKICGSLEGEVKVGRRYCLYIAFAESKMELIYDSNDQSFALYDSRNSIPYEVISSLEMYDWLNSHMIDYRGLIDKGLAMSVFDLKENPYEQ